MPLLTIETNQVVAPENLDKLLGSTSALIADLLNKSESYVMVRFTHNEHMRFAGSNEAMAFLQLKSIGLPESATARLSAALCEHMTAHLRVPKHRTYIEFVDAPRMMWGYNGGTF